MGTLVDDLFLLAQLDQERPLHFEPVDLVDLVRRSVDASRRVVAGPTGGDRRRRPAWSSRGRGPAATGRRQPAVNAVNHTPAGTSHRDQGGRRGRVGGAHRPRRRPGHRSRRCRPDLRAVLPVRPVPGPVVRRRRPGTGHRGGHRRRPTGARSGRQPGPGATFEVRIPKHRDGRAGPPGDGVGDAVVTTPSADHGSPGLRRFRHRSHRSRRRRRRQDRGSLRCRTGGGIVVRAQRVLTTPVLRRSARAIGPAWPA